jgi:hypothetical protein
MKTPAAGKTDVRARDGDVRVERDGPILIVTLDRSEIPIRHHEHPDAAEGAAAFFEKRSPVWWAP